MSDDLTSAQRQLNAARARQRRAKLGPPLDQTGAALDALSEVSEHDLGATEAFIRDANPLGVALFRAGRAS